MVSAGMTCIKYLLYVFNLLFSISGILLLTVGSIVKYVYSKYDNVVGNQIDIPAVILIVVGVIILIVAFFGCCGVIKENYCMITTFASLLSIILILELAAGIAGYVWQSNVENQVNKWFNTSMQQYSTNKDVKNTWDIMQVDLHCCGTKGPSDWEPILNNSLPESCCMELPIGEDDACKLDKAFRVGCFPELRDKIRHNTMVVAGIGIGIPCIQMIGIAFACCLAKHIRREYQSV